MSLTVSIEMPRRRAEVLVSGYWADRHDIKAGIQPCHVLGLFQDAGEDGSCLVFVCELDTGHVIMTPVDAVKFVDTDERGVIL